MEQGVMQQNKPLSFVSDDLWILEDTTTLVIPIPKVLFTTLRAEKHLQYKQRYSKAPQSSKLTQILSVQKEEKAILWIYVFYH